MRNRKLWFVVAAVAVLTAVVLIVVYNGKPRAFPDEAQALEMLRKQFPNEFVKEIAATVPLDSRHVFVPHVASDGKRGMSFWRWSNNRWRPEMLKTVGEPSIWKLGASPDKHYLVWHVHPSDGIAEIRYHLVRERHGYISQDQNYYYPRFQMELQVKLDGRTYGVMPYPEEWAEAMKAVKLPPKRQDAFMSFLAGRPEAPLRPVWIAYASDGTWLFPEHTVNGSSYHSGDVKVDWVPYVDEYDLEL